MDPARLWRTLNHFNVDTHDRNRSRGRVFRDEPRQGNELASYQVDVYYRVAADGTLRLVDSNRKRLTWTVVAPAEKPKGLSRPLSSVIAGAVKLRLVFSTTALRNGTRPDGVTSLTTPERV